VFCTKNFGVVGAVGQTQPHSKARRMPAISEGDKGKNSPTIDEHEIFQITCKPSLRLHLANRDVPLAKILRSSYAAQPAPRLQLRVSF
jgi:hypothetical protein